MTLKKRILAFTVLAITMFNLNGRTCYDTDRYIHYDYIIVGNGTVGSVLARKLSDDPCKKVLVLEYGTNQDDDPTVLDVGPDFLNVWTELILDQKFATNYLCPSPAGALASVSYYESHGWGGSSKHNFLDVVRGTPSIYDAWALLSGNPQWSYDNMLPLMLVLENFTPFNPATFNPAQRGKGGPISMTDPADPTIDPVGITLANYTSAGFVADYNDPTETSTTGKQNLGVCSYQMYATAGSTPGSVVERSFSSRSYLTPSVVTPEGKGVGRLLRIESNALVSRVIIENKRAIGVEFIYGENADRVLQAFGKKIILCAGSINSPAILQRSGIGDPSILTPLGIDVVVNNPNVGAHLVDHPGAGLIAQMPSAAQLPTSFPGIQAFSSAYSFLRAAPFTYPDDNTRRIQTLGLTLNADFNIVGFFSFVLDPKSRGSVQIASPSPLVKPNIDLNFYSDDTSATAVLDNGSDVNLAVTSLYILYDAIKSMGGTALSPTEFDFTDASSPFLLADAIKTPSLLTATSHIIGTTRMATSIATGVVDGKLNVFGVENLMVADVGVIPQIPDGNICYAAYMIALRAATILGVPVPPAL